MEEKKVAFIIGAPRSGTTWLHMMMGSHNEIVTGQESQVFNEYLAPLYARWQRELNYPQSEDVRKHGIAPYISEEEFLEQLGLFAGKVFENACNLKPEAKFFLEKSPNSSPHVELITKCFPNAHFIHVIRDGRDVATSMMAAAKGWGKSWAPNRVEWAATEWRDSLLQARKALEFTKNYTEVRYEDLLSCGTEELTRIFKFVDVSHEEDEVKQIYDEFSFSKVSRGKYSRDVFKNPGIVAASGTEEREEPKGFFRKGVAGDWVNHFSSRDVRTFNWVAGNLLTELEYAKGDEAKPPKMPPLGVTLRKFIRSAARGFVRKVLKVLAPAAAE